MIWFDLDQLNSNELFTAKATLFSISAILSASLNAGNLCLPMEKTIFSFETKSQKTLSVCKKLDGSYLAYRFGTRKNTELLFPLNLDKTSWKKFEFHGMSRGGDKANAGFGDYSLSFKNGNAEYTIFHFKRSVPQSIPIRTLIPPPVAHSVGERCAEVAFNTSRKLKT